MFVSREKYARLNRLYEHEAAKRAEAEQRVDEKDTAIHRLQSLITHQRDEQPDTPIQYEPATGDARLRQRLDLSERARRSLDTDRSELIAANVELTREVQQLRDELAAAQSAMGRAA
jgi:chromosome segregation ATPase